jgi:hypothetical protein
LRANRYSKPSPEMPEARLRRTPRQIAAQREADVRAARIQRACPCAAVRIASRDGEIPKRLDGEFSSLAPFSAY